MMMNDEENLIFYCYYCYCTIVVIGPSYPFSTRACSVILYVTGNLMI